MIFVAHNWETESEYAAETRKWSRDFKSVLFGASDNPEIVRKVLTDLIQASDKVLLLLGRNERADVTEPTWTDYQRNLADEYSKPLVVAKLPTYSGNMIEKVGPTFGIAEDFEMESVLLAFSQLE